jgi:hypothetical protein
MTFTFIAELILEALLAATLVYCIVLERRLAAVRKGQEGLSRTVGELNMAIAGAGASLRALKAAANDSAATLDERLKRARLHIDELSVLTASGERIASRMESAAAQRGGVEGAALNRGLDIDDLRMPSTSIMNRLNTARASQ